MANIRIINQNIAKTADTITATTEAGSLVVENMQNDRKSVVWRSTSKTAQTITLTWTSDQYVNAVIIPFCNFTSTATMQVKVYSYSGSYIEEEDTGAVSCCPYVSLDVFDWGAAPLGVNAYSVGAYAYARVYLSETHPDIRKVEIIINDSDNDNAYVEAGGLIVGQYFSTFYNASYNPAVASNYTDTTSRSSSGDLVTFSGTYYNTLTINFDWLKETDRDNLYNTFRRATNPIFVSLYPEDVDSTKEQQGQIYGKLDNSGYSHNFYANYTSNLVIKEI